MTTAWITACVGLSSLPALAGDQKLTDRDITLAVETDLAVDDAVPAYRIAVTTTKGVVTLNGNVSNILAKDRALERAMSIKGVRSIINRIEVEPPDRTDADIRRDVKAALVADPATDSYEIDVAVSDGIVSLTGTVDSWQEKKLASAVTKGVRDVVDVQNRIVVDARTKRDDYEIQMDVERRLAMSVWTDDRFIDVDVENGTVTLSGKIGSASERRRAAAMARVAGVTDVSTDDLEIDWRSSNQMRRKDRYPVPSDNEIADAVEAAMLYDPRVFSFNVDADVQKGVVTLTGTVDNLKAKRAAEQNARNTLGVWHVKNHLYVRPMPVPADTKIAVDVRGALVRDPYVERYDVDVDVIGGRVYLSGTVNTSFEQQRAEDVASRVKGVLDVVNNLDYEHKWTWLPDAAIAYDVKSQLFWSPFVDSENIGVTVEDGIVTLTGTVTDWTEWRVATENAFEGNAKDVRNKLKVVGG